MTDFLQTLKREIAPFLVRNLWPIAGAGVHMAFDGAVQREVPQMQLKVLLLCVYRYKNASIVAVHLEEAKRQGWEARLWALDKVHPVLESYSVGAGEGLRMPLLNRLLQGKNLSDFDWVVIMDDDFEFVRGTISLFLALAGRAGLALAQPARALLVRIVQRQTPEQAGQQAASLSNGGRL